MLMEAFDADALENASFNDFVARLVSKQSLASGPNTPTSDSRGATVLGAQARPPRRPLKDITCFGCRKSGHYQTDCPTAALLLPWPRMRVRHRCLPLNLLSSGA